MSGLAATLGLQLDARGFVTAANQASGALFGLGNSARKVESQTKSLATNAAISLGQMASTGARDIGSLIRSASGLAFALNPLAGAISLAVVGIGTAWMEARKEAKKAQDDMLADAVQFASKLKQTQDAGLLGMAGVTLGVLKQEARRAMNELASVGRQISQAQPVFTGAGGGMMLSADTSRLEAQRQAIVNHLVKIQGLIRATEKETTRITLEEAAKRAKADEDAWQKRLKAAEEATRIMHSLSGDAAIVGGLKELFSNNGLPKLPSIFDDLKLAAKGTNDELEGIVRNLRLMLEEMSKAEQKERERTQTIGAGAFGIVTGIMSRSGGIGGAIGSAVQGGLAGGAAFGVPGAVMGALNGLASSLLGMGGAARLTDEEVARLRRQFEAFTDDIKEQLGVMSPLEARMREATRQFAAMRDEIGRMDDDMPLTFASEQNRIRRETATAIEELNRLERQYLDLLREQEIHRVNAINQESAILRLRIQGDTELADAMQRTIDKQNELRAAHEAGASQAEITAIKERQRLEDILQAVEQTQQRIAAFAATISNLQAFRNSLLLSPDAGLSPTDQLAEARRQYEEILAKALGGDQAAAGQLPGAAQTLLEFSRAMNASGPAFQNDLQQILADNAAVIAKFEDLKTIEELMLEELRKIAEDTGRLSGRAAAGAPNRPPDRGFLTAEESQALVGSVALMQDGFLTLRNRLDTLTARVEEQTQVNRSGFQEFVANAVNN